jgi:hypothetical protein
MAENQQPEVIINLTSEQMSKMPDDAKAALQTAIRAAFITVAEGLEPAWNVMSEGPVVRIRGK